MRYLVEKKGKWAIDTLCLIEGWPEEHELFLVSLLRGLVEE